MTKESAIKIAEKFGMDFIRDAITREGCGLYLESDRCIPELDKLAKESTQSNGLAPCWMEAEYTGGGCPVTYRLYVPARWLDLWGWA